MNHGLVWISLSLDLDCENTVGFVLNHGRLCFPRVFSPFQAVLRHELDLIGLATKQRGKIAIVAVNKWDAISQRERVEIRKHIMSTFERITEYDTIPVVFISAQNRQNLSTLISRCLVSLVPKANCY